MTNDYLYRYPPLYPGVLLRRYKRFFADVELASGEIVTAHCPNTGPMTGVCTPGSAVQLSYTDNPNRKLPYTWEMIQVHDNEPTWVGINTNLPNRIIKLALETYLFPQLGNYSQIRPEVSYGENKSSRVDFLLSPHTNINVPSSDLFLKSDNLLLTKNPCPIYLEVKNTTWAHGKLALFPDTETTRGQKHLRELTALLPQNRAVMLYFINRSDCTEFAPGDSTDPVYGKLFRLGIELGLEILPCRFEVNREGVRYLGLAECKFGTAVCISTEEPAVKRAIIP
ncbi:MAG: DNA/RNA nuclease SfsA [Brasilonema octagenarum HA4186-MV1]|jgi:sugar fermentation stimulation protein A|uniref:Sugar fermentation stimulation protein homolog n=1 Tax=Brasilonema sennae CENA114 TaxID=415709 RepID=A0A856M826_9CYAN|nr:DNA/RNA nuclease SfsA [Brasilonema sennae]MBW4625992.1 DNA/RNA nuclease SfsA [Brasilonema octagenarum HA4186-MV1]QDL07305.1 DNA/RNA nuclease SfsA [Brasilonema sennae CENA114]QDL13669.1 DNA/RNA nuclease SfsA [Brasilonema octagenarum UFV-E1]